MRVNELLVLVGVSLQRRPGSDCPAADLDGDGRVAIAEIIAAVGASLHGCPAAPPTPTATGTATPTATGTATPTATGTATPTATVEAPTPTASASPAPADDPFVALPCPDRDEAFTDCWPTAGISIGVPYLEIVPEWRLSFDAFCSVGYLASGGAGLPDLACASMERGLRIYRNEGDFRFRDVTTAAGLASLRVADSVASLTWGDLDGDGQQDLVVGRLPDDVASLLRDVFLYGEPFPETVPVRLEVHRNEGGTFRDVTEEWGFGVFAQPSFIGQSIRLADVNGDGRLDVAVKLLAISDPTPPLLFVSGDDGRWMERGTELFGADHVGNSYAIGWIDADTDGRADLLSVNSAVFDVRPTDPPSTLLRRSGEGFAREPIGVVLHDTAAMGAAAIDADGDGWMEILVTDIRHNHWLKRRADGSWDDLAAEVGLRNLFNVTGDESSGQLVSFAAAFIPVLGELGVLITAGTDGGNVGIPYTKLFAVGDREFIDRSDLLGPYAQQNGEGLSVGDFDGDACPDVLISGHSWFEPLAREWIDDPPALLWNRSSPGRCLSLAFRPSAGNSYGRGVVATVESGGKLLTQALYDVVSEYGGDEMRLFFPVDPDGSAAVSIRWPDGSQQHVQLPAGRHTLHQP